MSEMSLKARLRSATVPLLLLCFSLACLCAGGLLAAAQHGILRAAFGSGGFAGYVYLFSRALGRIGLANAGAP